MKKLQELRLALTAIQEETRSLNEAGKVEEAGVKLEELRAIKKQIAIQEEVEAEEIREVQTKMENRDTKTNEVELRDAFYKAIAGKTLNQEERALVQSAVNADGGYLVPKDIQHEINELKRQYKSAKELIGRVNVSTESGSFVVEDTSTMAGLVNFDDDNAGLAESQPKFRNLEYKVKNYGSITPVAKSFLQDETANFMNYLNGHFAKKAIMTENTQIFAALKLGKTAKVVANINDVKKIVNVNLDPSIKSMSIVATNQDGFNALDLLVDGNGRPMLQMNPADSTQYLLLGMPVHVFSNRELPTVATKAPMFIGSLEHGAKFFDRGVYEVAVSNEAGFKQNQVVARVVERFDVKQADADAYVLAEITVVA